MYIFDFDNGLTITACDIKDRVEFLQQVNPDTGDLILGVAGMSELNFTIFDLEGHINSNEISGKQFKYYKSNSEPHRIYHTGSWQDARIVAFHGDMQYFAHDNPPYFTVRKNNVEIDIVQPPHPVKCIYINNDRVYLGHDNVDYMSVYTLDGTKLSDFALTPFCKSKIMKNKAIDRQATSVTEFFINRYDMVNIGVLEHRTEYEQVGVFTANKPTRESSGSIRVVAHDNMCKFDCVVDNWVNSLPYPITAFDLLQRLCLHCGVSLATTSITNGDYLIGKKFDVDNTTGRNILQWICELSACYGYTDGAGALRLEFYHDTDIVFRPKDYSTYIKQEYAVAPIDKIQVKVQDNDIGVIVPADAPDKTNAYVIQNNPLMYTMSDTALRPYATNIYNKLKSFSYVPTEIDTMLDTMAHAKIGDIISIVDVDGTHTRTPVMARRIVGEIESYISTGNPRRAVQNDSANLAIKQLQGRTNQMVNTIDEFSVTLTEVKSATETNTTQLKLTQGEILLKVDADGIISAINLSKEGVKISGEKVDITGFVTFSDLEGEGTTTINGSNIVTGYIVAEVIEASTTRLKYLSIGDKPSEDGFPTRLFPAGIRWADNSFLLTDNQEGVQMLTLATTGDMLELGAKYQVLASSDDEGNPMFMHMPNPAMKIYKDRVDFLKPTSLAWVGTQAEYDALTEEQKNYYTLMGVY